MEAAENYLENYKYIFIVIIIGLRKEEEGRGGNELMGNKREGGMEIIFLYIYKPYGVYI